MRITQEVFLSIYEKYKNTVYSVVFNYVRNVDDAADIQQDVFIKLLQSENEFDSEEHIKAWLIQVSVNRCKNFFRGRRHMADMELTEEIPYEADFGDYDLMKNVLDLPVKYRIPIHLFYYEDYSIRQIATTLETPEATIKIRLKRGRERLKKMMEKEEWL